MSDRSHERGGRQDFSNQMLRMSRSTSVDTNDRQYAPAVHNKYQQQPHHQQQQQQQPPKQPYGYRGMPPAYPPPPHPNMRRHAPHGYPYTPQTRGGPQNGRVQSVVSSSFSIEDEREDTAAPRGYYQHRSAPPSHQEEDRHPCEQVARLEHQDDRELTAGDSFGSHREAPPMFDVRAPANANPSMPIRIPPSPGDARQMSEESPETSASKVSPDTLKRSFWHHSRPADSAQHSMHPAFAPPKRAKVGSIRKERDIIITPRTPGSEGQEYARANSWAGPDDESHRHYRQTNSFPSPWDQHHQQHVRQSSSFGAYPEQQQQQQQSGMNDHYQRTWSSDETASDRAGGAFRSVQGRAPPRSYHPIAHQGSFSSQPQQQQQRHWGRAESYDWSPEQHQWHHQNRDDVDGRDLRSRSYSREMSWDDRDGDMRRQVTFEPNAYRYYDAQQQNKVTPNTDNPRSILKRNDSMTDEMPSSQRDGPLRLLAQLEDRISLSETLCTIRENIEVFMATKTDVEAPAPGRKHPVVVGQVGLRCVHCRHTTKSSDRVKRAVCYPSSIKRIYRTVIDMKLDHFAHCRFVPKALKDRLEELKAINTRSTGTTMQYFVRAASKMGMVDASSGVRLVKSQPAEISSAPSSPERTGPAVSSPQASPNSSPIILNSPLRISSDASVGTPISEKKLKRTDSGSSDVSMGGASDTSTQSVVEVPDEIFVGKTELSLPEDKMALSPLRCFLRENVYAFSATDEDIAVRTPTTFSVVVGQVGIGCVHCHALPAKERSNRAVCFPFAINRIYQSVADIQRFHLAECKMVPPEVRTKFQELQSASSKGSKGLATRQYWVNSAKKVGLVDTTKGIRFGRDPAVPATQAVSLDILAQVASNVTTVDRPLVFPEDKPFIAEFLYAVMEMLQPCRFTEADRNKRRLKDVGCIGVECKHCAGQVESRKFFWSSVNAVESNFVSVHTHMMECKNVPAELKAKLREFKAVRKEQTARLKTGSQKAFFQRVWKRLHDGDEKAKQSPQEDKQEEESKEREELQATLDAQLVTVVKSSQEEQAKKGGEQSSAHVETVSADIRKMAVSSVEV